MKNSLIFLVSLASMSCLFSQRLVQVPTCKNIDTLGKMHYNQVWANPLGPSRIFDSLDFVKFSTLNNEIDTVLAKLNYINIVNKYLMGRYYLQQGNKEKAIITFKEIMRFPFWGINVWSDKKKQEPIFNNFFEMYWKSGHYLIEALAGDVEELKKLEFVPASHAHLLWRQKDAIEKAGGVWSKGEINFPLMDKDLLNFNTHSNSKVIKKDDKK